MNSWPRGGCTKIAAEGACCTLAFPADSLDIMEMVWRITGRGALWLLYAE